MIYTFVKHVLTDTGEFTSSKTFDKLNKAQHELFEQATANSEDKTVQKYDGIILNDLLVGCYPPIHYVREDEPTPEPVAEPAEETVTE